MSVCLYFRPSILPDPNDGSLYVLGGKHKEGLMVKLSHTAVSFCFCDSFVLNPTLMFRFVSRNYLLPSQSWFSLLPAEALTAYFTQVRHKTFVQVRRLDTVGTGAG